MSSETLKPCPRCKEDLYGDPLHQSNGGWSVCHWGVDCCGYTGPFCMNQVLALEAWDAIDRESLEDKTVNYLMANCGVTKERAREVAASPAPGGDCEERRLLEEIWGGGLRFCERGKGCTGTYQGSCLPCRITRTLDGSRAFGEVEQAGEGGGA